MERITRGRTDDPHRTLYMHVSVYMCVYAAILLCAREDRNKRDLIGGDAAAAAVATVLYVPTVYRARD